MRPLGISLLLAIFGISLIVGIMTAGCSTAETLPPRRITDCLTDPGNNALHCDGTSMQWGDHFRDYVCRSLDDDEYLKAKCRR